MNKIEITIIFCQLNRAFKMTSNKCKVYAKFAAHLLSVLYNTGIVAWIISILIRENPQSVSAALFGYTIAELVVQSIKALLNCALMISNGKSKLSTMLSIISVGLFIWNCVLLFNQIGIGNVDMNLYTQYVYVQFILYCIEIGAILVGSCIGCICGCVYLMKDETSMPTPTPTPTSTTTTTTTTTTPTSSTPDISVIIH